MSRTTDKYVKIKKLSETAPENEIRIRAIPQIGRYISYAASLLLEKKMDTVLIKASGNATKSACQIAEILRHRILGLHQLNHLKTISVIDEYEPREEGLDRVVVERKLAVLEISLSLKDNIFDNKAPGYQSPLPKDEVQEEELKNILGGRRGGAFQERGERRPRRFEGGDREFGGGERGFRRGRYAGPRGRGGFGRGSFRGGYGGRGGGRGGYSGGYSGERRNYSGEGDRGDRGERGDRGDRGDRGGDRGDRGYDRGDRGDRGYDNRGDRGDRGDRGGYGNRGGYENRERGDRGDRGERGGYSGGDRGGRYGGGRGGGKYNN